jgi:hypothetical protein
MSGLGLSAAAQAQQTARAATRIDSLRAVRNGKPHYFPAVFTFVSGKQATGYVDSYGTALLDRVDCYEVPPDRLPPPPVKTISIERLKSMTVDGHTLEALTIKGKPLKILAENMTPAGGLQLYGYYITKADMFIPIPLVGMGGAVIIPVGSHDKYFWYARPVGGELREVPRSDKAFAELMGALFSNFPELAGRVKAQEKDTGFKNMPQLIQEYNAHFAGK